MKTITYPRNETAGHEKQQTVNKVTIAVTAASYSGNKGAAAMLQSSLLQLKEIYGSRLDVRLMSVYPGEDLKQCPHDFVKIIPAQPQKILFEAFPCAVLYRTFFWCPPVQALLIKNKILKTYLETDLVIDEAGIAFSDSRGFIMNTYAFACAAVPMLMGTAVIKYSQALGPLHHAYNRFLAGLVLPRMKLVIARGRYSYGHLKAAGIYENVRLCADGAFSMPQDKHVEARVKHICAKDGFSHTVALSVSSVVEKKCKKAGIDYCEIMAGFIEYLTEHGFQVFMFANAARINSRKPRNNDLMTADAVARAYWKKKDRERSQLQGMAKDTAGKGYWSKKNREHSQLQGSAKDAAGRRYRSKKGRERSQLQGMAKDTAGRGYWKKKGRERSRMQVSGGKNLGCSWIKTCGKRAREYSRIEAHRKGAGRFRQTVVHQEMQRKKYGLIWERREMDAEEIRAYIGQCEMLVASRFHAMVFALSEQVPVLLTGWSHKYLEVMEQFGLGEYAADFSKLSLEGLIQKFEIFQNNQEQIRCSIKKHLPAVQKSSRQNIRYAVRLLDEILKNQKTGKLNHVIDLKSPDQYLGRHISCCMGYAADDAVRANAASGGMVTALLCSLLKNHDIDGAWVVKTAFAEDGSLTYQTYIATTIQQIQEASSSVYMNIPMLSHLDRLRQFDGKLAVVLTPCMMRALCHILEKDSSLREKIVIKIGLFCSGTHDAKATEYALDKCRLPRNDAVRLYYRRGHWRGISSVVYADGSRKDFSYTKSVCAYKNAYFFIEKRCLSCKDQFAETADISFGDVWLPQMKKEAIKYTGCVIRSPKACEWLKRAREQGDLHLRPMTEIQMLKSQMRALTFKYRGTRLNHRLAGWLAEKNRRFSTEHPKVLKRIPMRAVYYYMCVIRLLLSW